MGLFSVIAAVFERSKRKMIKTCFPSPIPLPECETLTGLHLSRQGMRSSLRYILSVEGEKTFFKITNYHPHGEEYRFNASEKLDDRGKCVICIAEDNLALREIEEVLVDCGTVGWDGFNEKVVIKNATDTGELYEVYLRFSGGSSVSVFGCDIYPDRYNEMFNRISKIFHRTVKWE